MNRSRGHPKMSESKELTEIISKYDNWFVSSKKQFIIKDILSAGYIKKDSIEVDEEKIAAFLLAKINLTLS